MEKPRVLVVDDNEATTTLITALLQREFAVETASDGGEALQCLKTRHYAAILLDLRMPHIDGFAVLDFLAQRDAGDLRRVMIVTASLSQKEMDRVRAYAVCGVIAKPFDVEALLAAVKRCAGTDGPSLPHGLLSSGVLLLLAEALKRLGA